VTNTSEQEIAALEPSPPAPSPQPLAICVEIGGTHISAAVASSDGTFLLAYDEPLHPGAPASQTLHQAQSLIKRLFVDAHAPLESYCGLAVTLPGTVRSKDGMCLFSPILQWEDVQVGEPLGQVLGITTLLVNNVQAAGLGELHFGAGRDVDNFACVTLGSGIGGSLFLSGQLYTGNSDSAGEIGHITVDPDGPECSCGSQGCLETLASGPAVARMAEESLKVGAQSLLTTLMQADQAVTAEMVYRAAVEGDALAIKIWEKMGRYLGLGLATLITLVNPARIILGGGVAQAFPYFEPTLREEVRKRARVVPRDFTDLVPSPLKTRAGLAGAAASCFLAAARGS
jgi:glucokinase-like ROK family protein